MRVVGAVVVTVSVLCPLPVMDAGLKLHAAPNGSPVHDEDDRLIVPL
jgi:hypothetical protein